MKRLGAHFFLLQFFLSLSHAQIDSIKFSNGQLLVGEIKSLNNSVLQVETDYSDSDFKVEWKRVVWLRTESHFLVTVKNGDEYFSDIYSINDSIGKVWTREGTKELISLSSIVYLKPYDDSFKDRFSAYIDIGLEMAKSKNLKQFTTRIGMGYQA